MAYHMCEVEVPGSDGETTNEQKLHKMWFAQSLQAEGMLFSEFNSLYHRIHRDQRHRDQAGYYYAGRVVYSGGIGHKQMNVMIIFSHLIVIHFHLYGFCAINRLRNTHKCINKASFTEILSIL